MRHATHVLVLIALILARSSNLSNDPLKCPRCDQQTHEYRQELVLDSVYLRRFRVSCVCALPVEPRTDLGRAFFRFVKLWSNVVYRRLMCQRCKLTLDSTTSASPHSFSLVEHYSHNRFDDKRENRRWSTQPWQGEDPKGCDGANCATFESSR